VDVVVSIPALVLQIQADSHALNMATCANATSLAGLAVPMATLALACGGEGWMSRFHSLVAAVLCPDMMTLLL